MVVSTRIAASLIGESRFWISVSRLIEEVVVLHFRMRFYEVMKLYRPRFKSLHLHVSMT